MNKRILTLFLSLTLLLSLAACGGNADTTDARRDTNEIVVGIAQDLENSLDPYTSVTAANREVLFNVFEGLVKPDADGNLSPAVAERWEISDDQLTYTFHLRPGVKFHDGSEVTAMDVAWSIDKAMQSGSWKALDNIDAVNIGDTFSVVLKAADSDFLSYMTLAITPENHADGADPVGTGPFKYVSRAAQQNLVLERFADYWGEGAKVDKVTYQIYENAEALVMALKSGAVDICAHLTATQANQLTESFDILEGTMNLVQAVYLNHAYEPLANETVRKALCYALDREQVFDVVADGHGTAVGSRMDPNFRKYFLPELADLYPHDTEKAKAMLAEAGYPDGFDLTITVPSNYQPHMDTAQVVAEQLRAIGVSNFMPHHIELLKEHCEILPMVNQLRLCPGVTQLEVVAYCKKNNILVEAYSPFGTGAIFKVPQMQQLAQKYGRSVGQICLRWSMQMGWLPLPKSANPDRVKENLNVFDFELEPEDVELIANLKGVCGEAPVPDEIHF